MATEVEIPARKDLRGPFVGFVIGAIFYGLAVSQACQYFLNYVSDSKSRKLFLNRKVLSMRCISALSRGFGIFFAWRSMSQKYIKIRIYYGNGPEQMGEGYFIKIVLSRIIKRLSVTTVVYALGKQSFTFLSDLMGLASISEYPGHYRKVMYAGYGSTCLIDCSAAFVLALILHKFRSSEMIKRCRDAITYLIIFFLVAGLSTGIAAISSVVLYTLKPSSLLYLGVEFSAPRLYANFVLALFNAKAQLKDKLDASVDLQLPSHLLFGGGVPPAGPEREDGGPRCLGSVS
ncbi:hypothetical protein CVT26_013403 [Gymnopilus dilepis]|uniref:DUF6534 domain-containing protein n=1 Tax=Gymnopilus dilepis TaxID=231916 RepID=A0A409VV37_9AGAR|nr:hypothetical protein CVT26_013403 [Gymnopilus dilepis]